MLVFSLMLFFNYSVAMRPTPYVVHPRMYEPVDSFEVADQLRYSQYLLQKFQSKANNKFALGCCLLFPKNK